MSITVALASLAPGLVQATQTTRADENPWAVICSMGAGHQESQRSAPAGDPNHLLAHCPFCALHSDLLALPPLARHGLTMPPLAFAPPRLFLQAPTTLPAWVTAQPRGPPLTA